jgi:hypothetical protein
VTQTTVIMTAADELGPLPESAISLQAGAVVLEQARGLIGRIVRYTAEVSEQTQCLTKPKFVIGSEVGLQAVTVHGAPQVAVERATRDFAGWGAREERNDLSTPRDKYAGKLPHQVRGWKP